MNEYAVIIQTSTQISPDDWEVVPRVLRVTDSTTIADIRGWYREHIRTGYFSVKISQLEVPHTKALQQSKPDIEPPDDLPF